MNTEESAPKPASGADVAKLHTAKRKASLEFRTADTAYDEALYVFEHAMIRKEQARRNLAAATTAYQDAKAEADQ